mmetsp:Transcript_35501/g.92515  ORF Transcript_35501/g.92515 Transcript_35501/m.92515 type:complete len:91 (-) Transcript_35501:1098-1370(-)
MRRAGLRTVFSTSLPVVYSPLRVHIIYFLLSLSLSLSPSLPPFLYLYPSPPPALLQLTTLPAWPDLRRRGDGTIAIAIALRCSHVKINTK